MPWFTFSTNHSSTGPQIDACEVEDVNAARAMGVVFAGDILREVGGTIYEDGLRVIITNDDGELCWDLMINGVEGPGGKR